MEAQHLANPRPGCVVSRKVCATPSLWIACERDAPALPLHPRDPSSCRASGEGWRLARLVAELEEAKQQARPGVGRGLPDPSNTPRAPRGPPTPVVPAGGALADLAERRTK